MKMKNVGEQTTGQILDNISVHFLSKDLFTYKLFQTKYFVSLDCQSGEDVVSGGANDPLREGSQN